MDIRPYLPPDTYDSGSHEAYGQAALDRICETIAGTSSGRNDVLNREAFSAGQLVGAGILARAEAERRLMAAAIACGYVEKDGAPAAQATIASGLDKGQREPRVLPERISTGAATKLAAAPASPATKTGYVPLPVWTEPGPEGKPKLIGIGKDEPPIFDSEVRRHRYRRAGGQIVRVKVKQKSQPAWVDWYAVRRPTDAVSGWQAKRPAGYVPVPYLPASSPDAFAVERRGEMLAWPEGERDADTLRQHGFLAFTFGGSSDVPDLGELLRGHHLYILADNDEAGERCISRKVEAAIRSGAASVKIVRFRELPAGGDASDFFEAGGTAEDLLDRAEAVDLATWARKAEEPPKTEPAASASVPAIRATPFVWRDPKTFPRREWVYGRHLIRKFLSTTVAPGAVGKSSLTMVEAVAMVTGRDLLGTAPSARLRVWVWNGEDPLEELERRVVAICLHYRIDPAELEGRLFLNSGRDTELVVATTTRDGTVVAKPVVEALTATIVENKIDVVVLDPFVATHRVSENDNMAIDVIAKTIAGIADVTNTSFELVHHVRKGHGPEITVEDGRGAVALLAAARSARVLNPMSKDEAERAGVDKPRQHFRVDNGKANLAPPPDRSEWFKLEGVSLDNGGDNPFDQPDHVAVVTPWTWPDVMLTVTVEHLRQTQLFVRDGEWREAVQAKSKWVGVCVARAMGLDAENKAHRATINTALGTWFSTGMLIKVRRQDGHREEKTFVEVGEWAND